MTTLKCISSINILVATELDVTTEGVFMKTLKDPTVQAVTIHDVSIPSELRHNIDQMVHALILKQVAAKMVMPDGSELQWVNKTEEPNDKTPN